MIYYYDAFVSDGLWDIESPETVTLASASTPLNKMLAVAGRLWCACGSNVYVINPLTVDVEVSVTLIRSCVLGCNSKLMIMPSDKLDRIDLT